jgi:rhodanese-related sulfurtransferase
MQTIDAERLDTMLDEREDWLLVDTLPPGSYERQHIPGAVNVPAEAEDLVSRVDELVSRRDDPVVVYCADEECPLSSQAARRLEQAGFSNVLDFEGGLEEWRKTGHAVTSDEGPA